MTHARPDFALFLLATSAVLAQSAPDAESLLSEATLRLDGDVGIELEGRQVAAWRDQSPSHNDATMSSAPRRPRMTMLADRGNHNAVIFRGATSLALTRPLDSKQMTLFIVGRLDRAAAPGIILGPVGANKNNQLRWEGNGVVLLAGPDDGSPITQLQVGGNENTLHVLAVRLDGQSTDTMVTAWRNTQWSVSRKFRAGVSYSFNSIGSYFSQMYLHGYIATLIQIPRALSEMEVMELNDFLMKRYQIPLDSR